MTYDLLIKGAKIFNNQEKPVVEDIAIKDGKIAARGTFITDSADRGNRRNRTVCHAWFV